MKKIESYQKSAIILITLLGLTALLCILWITAQLPNNGSSESGNRRWADIYQNGDLLESIALDEVVAPYTFTLTGDNGCTNEIQVRPGSIGILSADCPDKLCVHQGFIDSTLLPITCLPNRLVIQIRTEASASQPSDEITPDMITH